MVDLKRYAVEFSWRGCSTLFSFVEKPWKSLQELRPQVARHRQDTTQLFFQALRQLNENIEFP